MRPKDFKNRKSGELRRAPEGHWTFVPSPLPPQLRFNASLVNSVADAERALGELNALGALIPNALLLIRPFMAREAVLSSRIEGTVTRLDQLLLFNVEEEGDSADPDDVREVQNYVNALVFGLERLKELPLCLRLLREVHERLMQGVRGGEKTPGRLRQCPVMIAKPGQSFEQARFVPPSQLILDDLLHAFERFLNDDGSLPVVVVAALAHYQFEAIHPFLDGNGRLGRLLISLLFHDRRTLTQPLLYLSAYFEAHDAEYRDRLLAVSQQGSFEEWIEFFAVGVAEQSRDAVARARRLLELQAEYRHRLQKSSQSVVVLQLVDELFRSPYLSIRGAAGLLAVTPKTAQLNIEKLEAAGILENAFPQRKRSRLYRATEILRLLDARMPPEPVEVKPRRK